MRHRETGERPQRLSVRGHLIGIGGQLRHQGHNRIDLRVHARDLLQMPGQRLARRKSSGANEPGHLDRAQETKGGTGLAFECAGAQRRGSQPLDCLAATRQVPTHGSNASIVHRFPDSQAD